MDLDVLSHSPDQELDISIGVDDEYEDEEDDIDIVDDGSTLDQGARRFNRIVGALETILIDPRFEHARESFCRSHCSSFDPKDDEHSLVHTSIFSHYTSLVEGTIETSLKALIPGFNMSEFVAMIEERKDQLMSEVFDLLLSMADFETFRDLMHSYKAEEEANKEEMAGGGGGGGVGGDSFLLPPLLKPSSSPDPIAVTTGGKVGGGGGNKGGGLRVSVQALKVHAEEQEDGEERPDLNGFALTISSPQSSRPK